MEVTVNIENYTETLRESLLALLFGEGTAVVDAGQTFGYAGIAHAFDRATTKALYQLHKTQADVPKPAPEFIPGPLNTAAKKATAKAKTGKKGGPAPGSQAAKDRALKAQKTRAANKAAKAAQATIDSLPSGNAGISSGTAGAPRPSGFGGTAVSPVAQVVSRGPEGN